MIQISYAVRKSDKSLIHIKNARKEEKYICLECKQELHPIKGEIRQHHFRHKPGSSCSGPKQETIIHKMAKDIIKRHNKILLKENKYLEYSNTRLEQSFGNYRPDVVITDNLDGEEWFIEVVVTHNIEDNTRKRYTEENKNVLLIYLDRYYDEEKLYEGTNEYKRLENDVLDNKSNREILFEEKKLEASYIKNYVPPSGRKKIKNQSKHNKGIINVISYVIIFVVIFLGYKNFKKLFKL